jgi:hypothetical protein
MSRLGTAGDVERFERLRGDALAGAPATGLHSCSTAAFLRGRGRGGDQGAAPAGAASKRPAQSAGSRGGGTP